MHVLVTGATGFIGANLVNRLAVRGHRVKALVRSREKAARLLDTERVSLVLGDITQPDTLVDAIKPGGAVIHLAARYADPSATMEMYRETNVTGTRNVMHAALTAGVARFLHCSTIGVAMGSDPPFDESTPYSVARDDYYEATKYEAEQLVLRYTHEKKLPAVVLRPVQPFGPGDVKKVKFYKLVRKGVVIGKGNVTKHLVYIDDLVTAFELALEAEGIEGQVIIVGGRETVLLRDLIRWAAEALEVREPRVKLPVLPLRALAVIAEYACRPLGIAPPLDRSRLNFFTKGFAFDTRKAEGLLGFNPKVPIREGVARTVEWYEQQGLL